MSSFSHGSNVGRNCHNATPGLKKARTERAVGLRKAHESGVYTYTQVPRYWPNKATGARVSWERCRAIIESENGPDTERYMALPERWRAAAEGK